MNEGLGLSGYLPEGSSWNLQFDPKDSNMDVPVRARAPHLSHALFLKGTGDIDDLIIPYYIYNDVYVYIYKYDYDYICMVFSMMFVSGNDRLVHFHGAGGPLLFLFIVDDNAPSKEND